SALPTAHDLERDGNDQSGHPGDHQDHADELQVHMLGMPEDAPLKNGTDDDERDAAADGHVMATSSSDSSELNDGPGPGVLLRPGLGELHVRTGGPPRSSSRSSAFIKLRQVQRGTSPEGDERSGRHLGAVPALPTAPMAPQTRVGLDVPIET